MCSLNRLEILPDDVKNGGTKQEGGLAPAF
jgi:hypothetical protein